MQITESLSPLFFSDNQELRVKFESQSDSMHASSQVHCTLYVYTLCIAMALLLISQLFKIP